MTTNTLRDYGRQLLISVITTGLVWAPLADQAYAASTPVPLADIPIAAKVTTKPNIVYTLDDSGSMQFGYLPDWVVAAATSGNVASITRVGTTATATLSAAVNAFKNQTMYLLIWGANQAQYDGTFLGTFDATGKIFTYTVAGAPATPATGAIAYSAGSAYCRSGVTTATCSSGAINTFNSPPYYAADFNALAYNPNVNYTPPIDCRSGACLPLTHTIGTDTDVNGNQINFAKVQPDPFVNPGAAYANLTATVAVPLYCNTDWPLTAGVNLAITDVGNANGEYSAGTGAWCRINGTPYDASAASGAPQVPGTYSYPYQASSGATGTQYFYRPLANKVLWCDSTSPLWPRNATITGCNGGTPVTGAPVQQTCNRNGFQCNPTVALRNYTPAACKTGPFPDFCAPNTGGSDGNSLGTGSPPECTACTCNADFQPAGGKCSVTAAVCNGPYGVLGGDPAECPSQPGPITGCTGGTPIYQKIGSPACNSVLFDPVANAPSTTTLLQDSNAQGYLCRHNNQSYAVSGLPLAGGPFTYSRTNAGDVYPVYAAAPYNQKGQFTSAVSGSCPTVGTTINIPRHYYTIDTVQFCNNIDTTVNGQWRGFGAGACQAANDLQNFRNVQYCPAGGCPETTTTGAFHRIDLVNDGRVFNYTDQATGAALSRTYAQEIINYANWYAYYRLRSLAGKTSTTLAFNLLDNSFRVGFDNLGTEPALYANNYTPISWVNVNDFTALQKKSWWTALFAVPTVTNYKTPSLSAMIRVGELFRTGSQGTVPGTVNPLPSANDPMVLDSSGKVISCQSNYHILFTDGQTNQVALPTVVGDTDQTAPATDVQTGQPWPPVGADTVNDVLPDIPGGAKWPIPFIQGTVESNTLSDVATFYWANPLRSVTKYNVPSWPGGVLSSDGLNNDITITPNVKDVAYWPHVQFSAISFGASGTIDASNQHLALSNIIAGTSKWPDTTATPNNPPIPISNPGAVAIDDLWHATVNSRGSFVYARSPLEVQYGLASILSGIANSRKSRSGAAFSGQVLSATNNIIYEPTIEVGWAGDLLKIQIDPKTGNQVGAPVWNASNALATQIKPSGALDEPWMDENFRRIVTWNGASKAAFRAVSSGSMGTVLSAAQLATLSPNATAQQKMVAYLRGGSTVNKPLGPIDRFPIEGVKIGEYRQRYGPIGDITNAQPLVVSAPFSPPIFTNTGADPGYAAYVTAETGRPDRIVVAANDGMVHIIDSADGHELFAYVPSELLRSTVDAAGKPNGLVALTFQDGGVPIYKHHFYVDSSPRTSDIDFNSAGVKGGSSNWHTIVVGGLGKGGASYYALDLTDPSAKDETAAAAKLMWEYHDADWTYTYGHPIIVKTYAFGWTVIVTSGYNNVSGEGRIYFLNPVTGQPYAAKPFLSTGAISCTAPDGSTQTSGLTQINGFTKDFHNQFTEQVYGGDLCGNFWRFDVHDPNPANWKVDLFSILLDKNGNRQPVTTAPQIEVDIANGVDRYVFIGTGRLLDTSDLTTPATPQPETMYAFRDGSVNTPKVGNGLAIPVVVTDRATTPLKPINVTGIGIAGGAPAGWYHDLPDGTGGTTNERIVVDVEADVNAVSYIGTQTTNDPCTIALPANVYVREYATAKSLFFDGAGNPWFYSASGGVGMQIVGLEVTDSAGNVIGIQLGGLLSHEVPGTGPIAFLNPTASTRNRFSWRLLQGQ